MKSIAFFNNKGGVGKTTLICNLAAYFARKRNKKVLVIDADPQCNTTSYTLDEDSFYSYYLEGDNFTISSLIPSLQDGEGFIKDYETVKTDYFGFDMIPGNPTFAACEDFLANEWRDVKAGDYRGMRSSLIFSDFLSKCTKYDYVFFDMGPSLGAINRSVLLACDYFLTPMSSDVFSLLALGNIGTSISTWRDLFDKGYTQLGPDKQEKINAIYTGSPIKFIGYVEQQYITKSVDGQPRAVRAYDEILAKIPSEIKESVVKPINHVVSEEIDYKIGSVPNYHSLVPMSQTSHKPIFELGSVDGVVGAHYQKVREFEALMKKLSENVEKNMEAV
ncbi:MAG: ParA family protein [Lachnospiraceae bacterium]|nr:ParA family protein [Lachnospiraceae bacterium]